MRASNPVQVRTSGNLELGRALFAELCSPGSRLRYRFKPALLLHLCNPTAVEAAVDQDPHLLLELRWREWTAIARRYPDLALHLVQVALSTAHNEVAREKRWKLVGPQSCVAPI